MTKAGLILLAIGLLLMVGSAALFGTSIFRAASANEVATEPIEVGQEITTEPITLSAERLGQVSVELDLRGDTVRQDGPGDDYELDYRFPVTYEVQDLQGNGLLAETTAASPGSGVRTQSGGHVTSQGGTMHVRHHFDKFEPPASGQVRVTMTLGPDQASDTEVQQAALIVYDNVSAQSGTLIAGFVACCSGPVLALVGLILLIIGLATGGKQ